jgi:hypothetical protein
MFYFIFSGELDPSEMEAGYKLDPEFLQRSPSHITIGKLTKQYNTFPRLRQKDDCPDKTNVKCLFKTQDGNYASPVFTFTLDGETGKHDSDGSEEFYEANDAESMMEQASTDKMEHPVTEKMTRDTSTGVEYAPTPELISR